MGEPAEGAFAVRFPGIFILILVLGLAVGGMAGLVIAAVILGVGYWFSVRLNPRIRHQGCGGTGRSSGWIYTWTSHRCAGCGGRGQVVRWGATRWGTSGIRDEAVRRAAAVAEAKRQNSWR